MRDIGNVSDGRLRIIVSGLAGVSPVGGMAWHYFQYVLGLHALGHEVVYHEDTWTWPFDPVANTQTDDPEFSVRFMGGFFERFAPELLERWHYRHLHGASYGMPLAAFERFASTADLWLNVSGGSFPPDSLPGSCVRAFIDTDPGYNQMVMAERFGWSENVDRWIDQVRAHDVHFTFGENIESPDCKIPRVGINWRPTRMPITLDQWRSSHSAQEAPWSTIMTWNAFKGPVVHAGQQYHSKGHEFSKFLDMPRRFGGVMTLALGGSDAPRAEIEDHGWRVIDGPSATLAADQYRDFILQSRGEFSTAKHIYVATSSGWFSERSACYLAACRPVIVQETGFSKNLSTGFGLIAFSTLDEAVDALQLVEDDYESHAAAAGDIATDFFDATTVLSRLLEDSFSLSRVAPAAETDSDD